ncbi:hypothetical protein [Zobellia sp. 1_MG-2023]|uniref:hypothetical protein n=1 Tax=Zobellia sp. 1_MG-2023 TaxID=3062626 RepID=UPI0026E2585F|nr:hypothetical protein [Zobellia sp. 1_MG-2023]MDO6821323.1 hypothetical protein [Zobellia sp. 1_MG-2023]
MLDYSNLIQLEQEIKVLLDYRLSESKYKEATVETYYAMDGTVICRIELFSSKPEISERIAKYEAEVKEGFYYEAEKILISQMELRPVQKFVKVS